MTKITTDWAVGDTGAQVAAKLTAIHDYYFGADARSGDTVIGDISGRLTPLLSGASIPAISCGELMLTVGPKLNALNDPDAFILSALLPGSTALVAAMPSPETCFTDTARTTPATVGQAVAGITDPSGYGLHPTQAVVASRPILRQAGTGEYYLEFDGVDDFLVTPTITPGTDKMQLFVGLRKISDAAGAIVVEYGPDVNTTSGVFALVYPRSASINEPLFISNGTLQTLSGNAATTFPAPRTDVLTTLADIGAPFARQRVNGVQRVDATKTQGTGNFGAYPAYIGMRAGTIAPFNGHIYSLILRFGPNLSDAQIAATERYVAARTAGVTL